MIREYKIADWPEVCRVFDRSKPYELAAGGVAESFVPLAEDTARMDQFSKSTVLVWEEGKEIRGFAGFTGSYIGWLFVEPDAFRKGIGRALLRQVVGRIDGEPWLWSMNDNRAAIGLYRSEGFEITEERATQNGGMPCIAVKLMLKQKRPDNSPEATPGQRPPAGPSTSSGAPHL